MSTDHEPDCCFKIHIGVKSSIRQMHVTDELSVSVDSVKAFDQDKSGVPQGLSSRSKLPPAI